MKTPRFYVVRQIETMRAADACIYLSMFNQQQPEQDGRQYAVLPGSSPGAGIITHLRAWSESVEAANAIAAAFDEQHHVIFEWPHDVEDWPRFTVSDAPGPLHFCEADRDAMREQARRSAP